MPEPDVWESFFDPENILTRLGLLKDQQDIVEFGCGYGTFTLPAARRAAGTVFALDIDPALMAVAQRRAVDAGLNNIRFLCRDFVADGTGLPDASVDYALLFNILHCDEPVRLLREVLRNLRTHGSLGIIHWVHDRTTPRGPPLAIRPTPEQCRRWAERAGFESVSDVIDLPPYHFGLVARPARPLPERARPNS